MKNAITALMVTILATIVATNGGDLYVTIVSILISLLKVAQAAGLTVRRNREANIYPYRLAILR